MCGGTYGIAWLGPAFLHGHQNVLVHDRGVERQFHQVLDEYWVENGQAGRFNFIGLLDTVTIDIVYRYERFLGRGHGWIIKVGHIRRLGSLSVRVVVSERVVLVGVMMVVVVMVMERADWTTGFAVIILEHINAIIAQDWWWACIQAGLGGEPREGRQSGVTGQFEFSIGGVRLEMVGLV